MPRYKNVDWKLPEKLATWEQVNTAVMMDIRDELKKLNAVFECYRFQGIPDVLKRIDKRLSQVEKFSFSTRRKKTA